MKTEYDVLDEFMKEASDLCTSGEKSSVVVEKMNMLLADTYIKRILTSKESRLDFFRMASDLENFVCSDRIRFEKMLSLASAISQTVAGQENALSLSALSKVMAHIVVASEPNDFAPHLPDIFTDLVKLAIPSFVSGELAFVEVEKGKPQ